MTILFCLVAAVTLGNEFRLGGDYITQGYYSYEDTLSDTLEGVQDIETGARATWDLDLTLGSPDVEAQARNSASFSSRSLRDGLGFDFSCRVAPWLKLGVSNDAEVRWYHEWFPQWADTFYSHNYLDNISRLKVDLRPVNWLTVNLSDGFELLNYFEPDSFSYNYMVNRFEAQSYIDIGIAASANAGYSWSKRRSRSEFGQGYDYDDHALRTGADYLFDFGLKLNADNSLARRVYPSQERSFLEEEVSATVGWDWDKYGVELDGDSRWTWHDSVGDIYEDFLEYSLDLAGELRPLPAMTIRLGPGHKSGRELAGDGGEDYNELSLVAAFDWFNFDRFWLSIEDRVGRRDYLNPDMIAYQSNYLFNELSLFGAWTIYSGGSSELALEGMANILPQWHAEKTDDFSVGIYTLELKYGF
jgi:hypothetical protein